MKTKTEYRIVGRFRKDTQYHTVDFNRSWSFEDAQRRLRELQLDSEREIITKTRKAIKSGCISIGTEYYSEYDLLDLRIQSRKVTYWSDLS
jgi:hypothetical protein